MTRLGVHPHRGPRWWVSPGGFEREDYLAATVTVNWLQKVRRTARFSVSTAGIPLLAAKRLLYRASGGRRFAGDQLAFYRLLLPKQLLRPMPRMTSSHERAFLEWYARRLYTGGGEIVDLGSWLGSTTVALARGLTANRAAGARRRSIHAYDLFVWEQWMSDVCRARSVRGFEPGESFLSSFESFVAPWRDRIDVHVGDLKETRWNGGPIEFLLVDAMKSWELANAIVHTFYSSVAPGGYVFQQDFCHFHEYWIHPIHYRLRHFLTPVLDLPLSAGVLFQLWQELPREVLEADHRPSTFDAEELTLAFDWAIGLVSRDQRPSIAAARVHYLLEHAGREAAWRALEDFRTGGLSFHSELRTVERLLRGEETSRAA